MTMEIDPQFLSTKCEEVPADESVYELVHQMFKFAMDNKGVGLAANQVGYNKRVIIVNTSTLREAMINPVITKRFGSVQSPEGCLSFPKGIVKVERSKQISVEWINLKGEKQKRKLRGLDANVVQHEVDHLDGKTIMHHIHALKKGEIR